MCGRSLHRRRPLVRPDCAFTRDACAANFRRRYWVRRGHSPSKPGPTSIGADLRYGNGTGHELAWVKMALHAGRAFGVDTSVIDTHPHLVLQLWLGVLGG